MVECLCRSGEVTHRRVGDRGEVPQARLTAVASPSRSQRVFREARRTRRIVGAQRQLTLGAHHAHVVPVRHTHPLGQSRRTIDEPLRIGRLTETEMEIGLQREQGDEVRAGLVVRRCTAGELVDAGPVCRRHVVVLADRPRQRPSDGVGRLRMGHDRPDVLEVGAELRHPVQRQRPSRAELLQQGIGEPTPRTVELGLVGTFRDV